MNCMIGRVSTEKKDVEGMEIECSSRLLSRVSRSLRYYQKYQQKSDDQAMTPPPFELEVVEAALMVATGEWLSRLRHPLLVLHLQSRRSGGLALPPYLHSLAAAIIA